MMLTTMREAGGGGELSIHSSFIDTYYVPATMLITMHGAGNKGVSSIHLSFIDTYYVLATM